MSESACCLQAAAEVVYVPDMQGPESATLMGAVGVRLRAALRSPSPPLVCSAARTAGQSISIVMLLLMRSCHVAVHVAVHAPIMLLFMLLFTLLLMHLLYC